MEESIEKEIRANYEAELKAKIIKEIEETIKAEYE